MISRQEATKIKIEKAKELIDNVKTSESVELFQSTFFNHERLKERLNHFQKVIEDKKKE